MKLVFKVLKEELELRYNMVVLLTNIIIIAHSLPLAKSTDTTFKSLLFVSLSFLSIPYFRVVMAIEVCLVRMETMATR